MNPLICFIPIPCLLKILCNTLKRYNLPCKELNDIYLGRSMLTLFPKKLRFTHNFWSPTTSPQLNKCLLDKLLHARHCSSCGDGKNKLCLSVFLPKVSNQDKKIYTNSYQESMPEERYKQTALEKKGKKFYFPPQRRKAIRRFREVAAFQSTGFQLAERAKEEASQREE